MADREVSPRTRHLTAPSGRHYFVFTGVLAMVTCAVFLRLNSVLKLAVLLLMIAIYSLLTEAFYTSLFVRYDTVHHNTENFLGTKETSLLLMAMFLLAVFYHEILHTKHVCSDSGEEKQEETAEHAS
ncbi:hypothetical protein CCH79_00018088 [Gambusia affinis]|uniref:Uncharacterized protein n=1 Tax=Gambusia affinis TaxID=33528 RepID=A0A315UP35_GAMAF|nr:hypothetical protein CCH79_00018088 [Gambusia affinis]